MSVSKERIQDLQKQVKIAREALERIKHGHAGRRGAEQVAEDALDALLRLDKKQPLQTLMGHIPGGPRHGRI